MPAASRSATIVCMCDGMNYVLDAEHALACERQVCRRSVLFALDQARRFVADTAANRMSTWACARGPRRRA